MMNKNQADMKLTKLTNTQIVKKDRLLNLCNDALRGPPTMPHCYAAIHGLFLAVGSLSGHYLSASFCLQIEMAYRYEARLPRGLIPEHRFDDFKHDYPLYTSAVQVGINCLIVHREDIEVLAILDAWISRRFLEEWMPPHLHLQLLVAAIFNPAGKCARTWSPEARHRLCDLENCHMLDAMNGDREMTLHLEMANELADI